MTTLEKYRTLHDYTSLTYTMA